MTIEEVSVLFDTGRKGNAQAAALALAGKDPDTRDDPEDDGVVRSKNDATAHIEMVGNTSRE